MNTELWFSIFILTEENGGELLGEHLSTKGRDVENRYIPISRT